MIQNFILAFQAQKPQPLVYIRTLLQNFLFQDMVILGRLSIRQVLDDDLSIVALPCSILLDPANDAVEAPHHPLYAIAHQMEVFRQRAAQSFLDIFRAFCQNRCRVRRTLFHSIQDWETVQIDAEEIDQLLQIQLEEKPLVYQGIPSYSLPLSSWAYHYKLRLMEWIVQLGFELEIYQPDELAGMYWYLSYLSKARAQHAERIKFFSTHRFESSSTAANRTKDNSSRGSSGGSGSINSEARFRRSKSYLRLTALEAAVTSELADALSCLYTALRRLGLVVPPPRPYSSDALRYEVRMKPFAPIGLPELPSFEEFERATAQPGTPTRALLENAARAAAAAKVGLEEVIMGKRAGAGEEGGGEGGEGRDREKEVFAVGSYKRWVAERKGWMRSVIAVRVAVETVKRAVGKNGGEEGAGLGLSVEVPKPEKGYHEWWIVPKVLERR